MMFQKLEIFYVDVVSGKKKGFLAYILRAFFYIISLFYGIVTAVRNYTFDKGWMRCYYAPVPVVISIGNIVVGGTGKTPVVLKISKSLKRDAKIAILTRGYRSPAEKLEKPILINPSDGSQYPPSYVGDEPYLLASNLPNALVYVGRNRQKSSVAASKAGAKVIILDDGMQFRSLARDFDVVVVDGQDPLGLGYLFPRGFLRESLKGLRRADLIIINHVHDRAQYLSAKYKLARYSTAPIVAMHPRVISVRDLNGELFSSLTQKKVGMFCGIGKPDHFFELLTNEGIEVVDQYICPDHVIPSTKELLKFAEKCQSAGAEALVCTEKDRVKFVDKFTCALPIVWFQIELEPTEGFEEWETFLEKVRRKIDQDQLLTV